ncbi:hypothetical protein [Lysobacter gummosus]|uniref:hypothetical protein n=1 Tax=Lysobacter gummosus TaxID=262324 RepID=UPI0036296A84
MQCLLRERHKAANEAHHRCAGRSLRTGSRSHGGHRHAFSGSTHDVDAKSARTIAHPARVDRELLHQRRSEGAGRSRRGKGGYRSRRAADAGQSQARDR